MCTNATANTKKKWFRRERRERERAKKICFRYDEYGNSMETDS